MTPKAFRTLALSFPEAHEEPHFERASFRVGKKIFATMTADGAEAMVRATPEGAEALIAGSPDVFFSYGGWTTRNGSLGVHLARVEAPAMTDLVTMAWRSVAPKRLLEGQVARDARPPSAVHGDPRVDAALAAAPAFAQPLLAHLRALVHEAVPDVTEDIKWGRPFFLVDGAILGNMAAFKQHCTFGFWSPEVNALLEADGTVDRGSTNGGGSFGKIRTLADLPERQAMLGYLKKAAVMLRTGAATSPVKARMERSAKSPRPEVDVPEDLRAALAKSRKAAAVFEGFSPTCRREYVEWVTSAKRQETRERRVAEAVARMANGQSRHAEYRR